MNFFTADAFSQVERLEKTGLLREQAVAIVQSQHEVLEHAAINVLATKTDLSECIAKLQVDMASMRAELRHEMIDSKSDIIKWVAGMLVAQAAVVSTLVKLL